MAWPLSRITDFIARQTKISAAFLNALQDWPIALSLGTVSLKSVAVDGTGGAAASAVAGDVRASRSVRAGRVVSGTTTPTPTVDAGEMGKGGVSAGWARVTEAGALVRGVGVTSVTRTGAGHYDIVFGLLTNPADAGAQVTLIPATAGEVNRTATHGAVPVATCTDDGAGRVKVTVDIFDFNRFNRDCDFTVSVRGE